MKKIIAIFLLFNVTISFSQKRKLVLQDSLIGNFKNISLDNMGNVFLTQDDVLFKLSNKFDTLFTTSLKGINPTHIQSNKTFRTLVFDAEQGAIQFYDNTLTDMYGIIYLTDLDVLQPILVCESFNGNAFWVLDAGNMRLVKFDQNLNKLKEIENLNQVFKTNQSPIQLFEQNDILYVNIENKGLFTFDIFGSFLKFKPIFSNWIEVEKNFIIAFENNLLNIYSTPMIELSESFQIKGNIKEFKYINNTIYTLTDRGVFLYLISK